MSLSLLPSATIWLALFAAAAFAWHRPQHGLSVGLAALGYACALAFGRLGPLALAPLALLAAAAWGVMPERPRAVRIAAHVVFAAVAIALSLHLIPGFHNPRVIGPTRFTPDAVPFTMYLISTSRSSACGGCCRGSPPTSRCRALRTGAVAAVATAAAAYRRARDRSGRLGAKWPPSGWLWLVNNLLIVTLAEEALFRGYVQGGLTRAARAFAWPWAALAIGAVLFGAAHAGGWQWIVLGTVAGIGYGLAWRRGGLLASALAHAG